MSKAEVVAIVNRKGGVGKTATVQALGAGLMRAGNHVLFIDLDSQCNLTYSTTGATGVQLNAFDVLTRSTTAQEAIYHTAQGDIIAGTERLAGSDIHIDGIGKEYRLKEALEAIWASYDYIIIDTPAALGTLTVNALTSATRAIIPTQADVFGLQAIGQLAATIKAIQQYSNPALKIDGILLTRFNGRASISKQVKDTLQDMAQQLHTKVYQTAVRECTAIKEAQASKKSIFDYAPKSNAAADYNNFISEFLGR